MEPVCIKDAPKSFGFRGVFINDEDLLTGWKEGSGIRDVDYHVQYYCCGPHIVPETGLDKLYYNLKLAKDTATSATVKR